MLVAFSVWLRGEAHGDSVRDAVAAAAKIVRASRLPHCTDPMFTTIEGEWDEVFDVIHRTTEAVAAYGARADLIIKADLRPGHTYELAGKMGHLEEALARQASA